VSEVSDSASPSVFSGRSFSPLAVVAAVLVLLAVIVTAAYLLGSGEDAVAEPELDPRLVEIIEDESLGSPLNFLLGIEEGQVDFAAM